MCRQIARLSALAVVVVFAAAAPAEAQERVEAGKLNCDVSAAIGLVIKSKREVYCIFTPRKGPEEVYIGTFTRYGLDVGATTGGTLIWVVYAPTDRPVGALAGKYAGASAEASIYAGMGTNVLVGGSGSTVALQPVSVQGQAGFNFAAGIAGLELSFVR